MAKSTARIEPLRAARALMALFRDPNDTAQVFEIIAALSGLNRRAVLERLERTAEGRRIVHERRELARVLSDRAALRALPEGSLGRAYLAFAEEAGITAEGLVAASESAVMALSPDERAVHDRLRDTHDLWHVVTGYRTDLIGEASVLAFTYAQTRNPGVLLVVLLALVEAPGDPHTTRRLMAQAFQRGLRAAWLPAADWETLLARPLSEVRRTLRIDAPPRYEPAWADEGEPLRRAS